MDNNVDQQRQHEMLEELETLLMSADFEAALMLVKSQVLKDVTHKRKWTSDEEIFADLRLRSMAVEVLDYFGHYADAQELIAEEGRECKNTLLALDQRRGRGPSTDAERKMLKQKVWATMHLGYCYYRRGQLDQALETFNLCLRVTQAYVQTGSYAAHGTISRAYYSIGLVFRERYDYHAARHNFTESIRHAWITRQSESNPTVTVNTDATSEDHSVETRSRLTRAALTNYNIAKCLALGLAFVHYTEGNLQLAIPLLLAAKHLLFNTRERIIKSYIDVVYACVLRAEKGDEPAALTEAIALLEDALKVFEDHPAYRVRAQYQLALAYIEQAKDPKSRESTLERAKQCANDIRAYANAWDDILFQCNGLLVESRIARRKGRALDAIDWASKALELGHARTFILVDGLIARGEARFELGRFGDAEEDFSNALRAGRENPKVAAACHLHLARTYARMADLKRSRDHMGEWKRIRENIRTAFLLRLEKQAERELRNATSELTKGFVVEWSAQSLAPNELEAKLHGFLVKWARARTSNDEQAARLLKISKQTFYNWKAESDRFN